MACTPVRVSMGVSEMIDVCVLRVDCVLCISKKVSVGARIEYIRMYAEDRRRVYVLLGVTNVYELELQTYVCSG